MKPTPSGRILPTPGGRDLVLKRTFRAPIADVWASITESERTARWFGSWRGEPGAGNTIYCRMGFEADGPEMPAKIEVCEAPRRLMLRTDGGEYGSWLLEAKLSEKDGVTELEFIHHLDEGMDAGSIGPGWEYYLDNLVASTRGEELPDFSDYYPSQQEYYQQQAASATQP